MMKKERSSNFELLRMVAMFMVLLVHADYFSLGAPTVEHINNNYLDSILRIFFEAISIVCVNVFVLISGWFGIKPSVKGLANFLFQCLFFLIGIYLTSLILGISQITLKGVKECIFAIPLHWFIQAYLLLYILSPVLNKFVEYSNRKEFKRVLIAYFFFVCTYGWIGAANFICNGYSTLFFIGLYLLARYVRIYSPKWSTMSFKKDLLVYWVVTIFVTIVSFSTPLLLNRNFPFNFWAYNSPTTILGALFLLLSFSKINFKNKFVNWCDISCFSVFLIHFNSNTIPYFRKIFIYLHDSEPIFEFWIITFFILIGIFFLSILVDKVRIKSWNLCCNIFIKNTIL